MQHQDNLEGFWLSPQQRQIWCFQQDGPVGRARCVLLVEGRLDIEILLRAVRKVVNRYEILRTVFPVWTGMELPVQVVTDSDDFSYQTDSLDQSDSQTQDLTIRQILCQEETFPFNLEQGPLLRLRLLILSAQKYLLIISLPALCADSWTLKNLISEINQSYWACLRGKEVTGEAIQYAQFAEWQNELLRGDEAKAGRDYWELHNPGEFSAITLPYENLLPGVSPFALNSTDFTLDSHLVKKIELLVKQYGVSKSVFLLTCWHTLLWRLTRQPDIVIDMVFDGRKYEVLRQAMGLFARRLPIHCNFTGNYRFGEMLAQVDKSVQEAYEWQEYFPSLENPANSRPSIGFEFEEPFFIPGEAGLTLSVQELCRQLDYFKVKLSCAAWDNHTLTVTIYYDAGLFKAEDIHRLTDQFRILIESVIDEPEALVADLQIMSETERRQLLMEFNQTKADYPLNRCIHQLFEEQAERVPNHLALMVEDRQLSYAELNAYANQVAHYLQRFGVKPETPVVLYVERSANMMIGLLGILKAGGGYVPLEPTQPPGRLATILEDTKAPVIITQQQFLAGLPPCEAHIICLDKDWKTITQEPDNNPVSLVTVGNLAYIIFTSGSTGRPKGVVIEHRQLFNYINSIVKRLELSTVHSFATVSTFAADLGNTVVFPSLCTGGCLHILSQEQVSNSEVLADYFHRYPVDCLKIVPSHLQALLASSQPEHILPRKRLVLGGEASSWELIKELHRLAPSCTLVNHYGPTETTVGVLTYRIEQPQTSPQSLTIPIGRPLANIQVYLLDSRLHPVPIGIPGEVNIGGDSLARGYLNNPMLTAEKFIPDPFSQEPGRRLYKTGDLARHLPDLNIEFLSRADDQIKYHGHRIELNELRTALKRYPQVRDAVIVATQRQNGSKILLAYYVSRQELDTARLRAFLAESIIEEIIPSVFIHLKKMPLTLNGKINYQALPTFDEIRLSAQPTRVAPRTSLEELLAEIWAEILGLDQIGIYDNFFEMGGHSLLAIQLISRVRNICQVDISLRDLFNQPSIVGQATLIERAIRASDDRQIPSIQPVNRDQDLPLSFAQERLWFLDQLESGSAVHNMPLIILRLTGPLYLSALRQTFQLIFDRHEILRTTFVAAYGCPFHLISPASYFVLPLVDLTELPETEQEAEIQRLAHEEARHPFDLRSGPLIRITLICLTPHSYAFFLVQHHIISDGWSLQILIREAAVSYNALCAGHKPVLPPLPLQYVDFAYWQRRQLPPEALESQLAYWRRQLAGELPRLELSITRSCPDFPTERGAVLTFSLSPEISAALRALSLRQEVTLSMTLLAAFETLLYRYSGQSDLIIGLATASRSRSETEGILGFFVNMLPVRVDLSGNPSFQEMLWRVREAALGAYAHQEAPFEKLVEMLRPERHLSQTPLFQVVFNFNELHAPVRGMGLPRVLPHFTDLTVSIEGVDNGTARFDLTLSMDDMDRERGQIAGLFEYKVDLFEAEAIQGMVVHFETILREVTAAPEVRLLDIPLVLASQGGPIDLGSDVQNAYKNDQFNF